MLDFVGAIIYNFNVRKYKKFFKGVALYESATDEGCGLLLTFNVIGIVARRKHFIVCFNLFFAE